METTRLLKQIRRFSPPIILAVAVLSCQGPEIPGAATPQESDVTGSALVGARFTPRARPQATAPDAGTVVLGFEGFPSVTPLPADAYAAQGVTVSGAVVLTAPSYNWRTYPPHGGSGVITGSLDPDPGTPVTVTLSFDNAYTSAEAFITSQQPVELRCTNDAGILVGTASSLAPNLEDNAPLSVYPPNDHVQVTGAGIRGCTITGPGNRFVVDDVTLTNGCGGSCAPPTATLICGPHVVVRADTSGCTLAVQGADSARILAWAALAEGVSTPAPTVGGLLTDSARWGGKIVVPTTFATKVISYSGTRKDTLTAQDSIQVTARNWQVLTPSAATVINAAPARWGMTPEPISTRTPTSIKWSFILGVNIKHDFDFWDPNGAQTENITSGPNSGLWYVRSMPATMVDTIYLHPQLLRQPCGQWCREQNGADATLLPRECTQADFPVLRSEVSAHEGVGGAPNSHWGYLAQFNGDLSAQRSLESMVTRLSESQLRYLGDSVVRTLMVDPRISADSALDAHYSIVWQAAGCQPDVTMDGH